MTRVNKSKPQIQMMTKVGSDSLGYYLVYMWLQLLGIILCQESSSRTKENPTHQGYIVSLSLARAWNSPR